MMSVQWDLSTFSCTRIAHISDDEDGVGDRAVDF